MCDEPAHDADNSSDESWGEAVIRSILHQSCEAPQELTWDKYSLEPRSMLIRTLLTAILPLGDGSLRRHVINVRVCERCLCKDVCFQYLLIISRTFTSQNMKADNEEKTLTRTSSAM
uniref:Uncharacterized protein n=1 Tax=Timema poppense TaxID=170557 RepID=A0A7R9H4E1_TIMPO|nr:unnamed protein product [Timema poppensis]